jgi:hypothetical protein
VGPDLKGRGKRAVKLAREHGDFEASGGERSQASAACFPSWKPKWPVGKSGIAVYMERKMRMDRSRKSVRWTLAGLAAAAAVVFLFLRSSDGFFQVSSRDVQGHVNRSGLPGESVNDAWNEGDRKASDRGAGEVEWPPDPTGGESTRASAIYQSSRRYLTDAELKRAVVFAQYEDAEGNSSSTMLLERPTAQELHEVFEDYLKNLSGTDREFVEQAGLSAPIKKDIADFFGYDARFRYVTFLLAGDGSASLPTVLILESDKRYNSDQASRGELEVPMDELGLKEFGDLKVGDPKLERYGKLFSIR